MQKGSCTGMTVSPLGCHQLCYTQPYCKYPGITAHGSFVCGLGWRVQLQLWALDQLLTQLPIGYLVGTHPQGAVKPPLAVEGAHVPPATAA